MSACLWGTNITGSTPAAWGLGEQVRMLQVRGAAAVQHLPTVTLGGGGPTFFFEEKPRIYNEF